VLLKFQAGTTAEQKRALASGLGKLPQAIPEILAYNFGTDAGLDPERNHDFAIMADFASEKEYEAYAKHPAHVELIQNLVKPILAPGGRVAVQFRPGSEAGDLACLPSLRDFGLALRGEPGDTFMFKDTLAFIEEHFDYSPKTFTNGGTTSAAGANEGSCKVFSAGKLLGWSERQVLVSFGEHYKQVLGEPDGTSHGNIRAFMKSGWSGVDFPDGLCLVPSAPTSFRQRLRAAGSALSFKETLAVVAANFDYSPKQFVNGGVQSAAGANEGSCKVFSMGKLMDLSETEVLACFAEHYRQVLSEPDGTSHGNIRAFMTHGWEGVQFPDGLALTPCPPSKRRRTA